ncbi:uncharacterized protein IL334_003900 [Kwoniella shivajii]|uniref:Uncharacterized protein n=1 Tax=Kwoniella shivajii TaxID=564305 RepID=A0ABZ1D0L0_9TREE|nr:hypothetical protein IL334_003900 [Kwoniella shivajii]
MSDAGGIAPDPVIVNMDSLSEDRWRPYDRPRIRHVTGIRIHQLTLPESLSYASRLIPSTSEDEDGYTLSPLGESSRSFSHRHRRSSNASSASYPFPRRQNLDKRERSSSTSTTRPVEPSSPTVSIHHTAPKTRFTRARAPTLAGEVLEHIHDHDTDSSLISSESKEQEQINSYDYEDRKPLKCFITLTLPPSQLDVPKEREDSRRRTKSDERDLRSGDSLRRITRTPSSHSISVPNTPTKPRLKHTLSSSSSNSSIMTPDQPRSKTVYLNLPEKSSNGIGNGRAHSTMGHSLGRTTSRLSDNVSLHSYNGSTAPSTFRAPNLLKKSGPSLSISHQIANSHSSPTQLTLYDNPSPHLKAKTSRESLRKEVKNKAVPEIQIPFYVSPIHHPSTHPRFVGLESSDFADWLTSTQSATDEMILEVWVEMSPDKWTKIDSVGGKVNLSELRKGQSKRTNGIEFTLSHDSKEIYHVANSDEDAEEEQVKSGAIVERSLRETRMKKGIGVGGLHQLVNLQAVISDTEKSIEQVRWNIDTLLIQDTDWRCLKRDISERRSRIEWLKSKVAEVEKTTREVQARITLNQQGIDIRRDNLQGAQEADELRMGSGRDLEVEIRNMESERQSLESPTHTLRAHHIQTLDSLFPIQSLDPAHLLYTILKVPLPIPVGTKDPAPPLSLPEYKVDERTTAAALGYVAMVVQILGNLGGAVGGLPYTITCAGSRSAVRDGTGVMQGPRSFPLYAKGVERYRYEYAVFLLNKNIEMIMSENNIRLLDLRHTLPNLKNLLLTLSSPNLPPPISRMGSRAVSYRSGTPTLLNGGGIGGWSRSSSAAWQSTLRSPGGSTIGDSPSKSALPSASPLRAIQHPSERRSESMKNEVELGSDDETDEEDYGSSLKDEVVA